MNAVEFLLNKYQPFDDLEKKDVERLRKFKTNFSTELYERKPNRPVITASGIVINQEYTKILMIHHRLHDFYKQFGGHADGNSDLKQVVIQELFEESAISAEPFYPDPIDLIVWDFPERTKNNIFYPEHECFDIAFLFIVSEKVKFSVNKDEGKNIKWVNLEEFRDNTNFGNIPKKMYDLDIHYNHRVYKKILNLKNSKNK